MKTTTKKSFILYTEIGSQLQLLSDEEAGMVFKALVSYNLTGEKAESDNKAVNVMLAGIISQMERDTKKYQQICDQRALAAAKRSEKRIQKKEDHEDRISKSKDCFIKAMEPYTEMYDRQMLNDFYRYWTELNPSHTKMRFEMQKTWETGKRLATWSRKSYNQR